jgi:hypothetical protein
MSGRKTCVFALIHLGDVGELESPEQIIRMLENLVKPAFH